ncbi:MAG TPA: sigma-70 family RNA polymerase sigma factor [Anaerolineae bacterium]
MEDELREQAHARARHTLIHRDWRLVGDAEAGFLEEVLAEVETRLPFAQGRSLEALVEHATIVRYGHVWHTACRAEGTIHQERAIEELHTLLFRVAFHRLDRDQQLAQDCAQAALVKTWHNLDRIEDPGSFLWWALRILNNEINKRLTAGKRRVTDRRTGQTAWQDVEVSASDLQPEGHPEEESVEYPTTFARLNGAPVDQAPAMTEDMRASLEAAIRACLDNERQQAVIVRIFFDAKSRREVAEELGTTPQIVSVFKQRALKRLQACEGFLTVLEELL